MQTLVAADLLYAWERCLNQHPAQRALTLLSVAWPETHISDFANMSIGHRDAALLTLHQELFGTRLRGIARCPQCSEQLELNFDVDQIRAPMSQASPESLELHSDGFHVQFRTPNSEDLLAIAAIRNASEARQHLLRRCLVSVDRDSSVATEETDPQLPETLVAQILEQMAQADPQGDVQLALACAACHHNWLVAFDILSYLWHEINDWAQRTLREVHLLAHAYGWSEAEILALSARRRNYYLALTGN